MLTPFFNLVLTGNRGMSFGLFNTNAAMNTAVFTVLAVVIVIALLVWLRRAHNPLIRVAIGMIIGGAVGNVIDRLIRGAVVDFLDFHLGDVALVCLQRRRCGNLPGGRRAAVRRLACPRQKPLKRTALRCCARAFVEQERRA